VESRLSDVVQGYAKLASSLLERWNTHAANMASKVDAGGYDATSMAEDLTVCASLATEGGLLLMAEGLEAFGGLTGSEVSSSIVTSQPFSAPAGASLTLAGPLVKGAGLDSLPVSAVQIQPPKLGPTEVEFTLRADGAGHRGATYVGTVEASTDAGTTPVTVWITVP